MLPSSGYYTLAGVISWGIECALPNYPGVFARVTSAMPWIMEKIGANAVCWH